jgi:hypothetical protein
MMLQLAYKMLETLENAKQTTLPIKKSSTIITKTE